MRRPLLFAWGTDVGRGVCVVDMIFRTINDKPSPAELSRKTKGPVDALLEHALDGGWVLIVVLLKCERCSCARMEATRSMMAYTSEDISPKAPTTGLILPFLLFRMT